MTSGMDDRPAKFGCSLKELRELMEHRSHEGYNKIQTDYGGVLELCKRLYTSPNEGKSCLRLVSGDVPHPVKGSCPSTSCHR